MASRYPPRRRVLPARCLGKGRPLAEIRGMGKLLYVSMAVWLVACVTDDAVHTSTDAFEIQTDNGRSLNGVSLNGISLNGISLNGLALNGICLNGRSLNGASLSGALLNGSSITSLAEGSAWSAALSNGETVAMRIDSATVGAGDAADIGMYAVSYQTTDGWQRLCGSDEDGSPTLALAVPGVWNQQSGVSGGGAYTASTTQFSWACRGKTIAKCVELGYKTWTGRTKQLTSCVRMLRGDYCGDGTPGTRDGQQLNVYDDVGVQADTLDWEKEAEWTPGGARCISSAKNARFGQLGLAIPMCVKQKELAIVKTCGTSFSGGATLISEYAGAAYEQ